MLQGSVVTQTVIGGLTMHFPGVNFLRSIHAQNYGNWLRVDKVIAIKMVQFFMAHSYSESWKTCCKKTDPIRNHTVNDRQTQKHQCNHRAVETQLMDAIRGLNGQ